MRLLTWNSSNEIIFTKDLNDGDDIPSYVILSHTWAQDAAQEVTFADISQHQGQDKEGYNKITFCKNQADRDGHHYFWIDTCCIDRNNHSELSEAITSMFWWYTNAVKCYVYLSDVSNVNDGAAQSTSRSSLRTSRWFTRGWTLQELLAPSTVEFFSTEGHLLGTKETLMNLIHEITTIPLAALQNKPLSSFSVSERVKWVQSRNTRRKEDEAYCLLGIFNISMTINYGEGDNALHRLQKKINAQFGTEAGNILTWGHQTRSLGLCLSSAPLIQPEYFMGRSAEIDAMRYVLQPDGPTIEQRRVVLGGMGGVGKTQLAIAYSRQFASSYTSIIWFDATSDSTVYLSLRSCAIELLTPEELDKMDNRQILSRFHEWLSHHQNAHWLLIFDNYDEPDNLYIDDFYPNIGQGAIVFTTRLQNCIAGPQIRVQPLHEIDISLEILQLRSQRDGVKTDLGARRLAQRLGGLPLALVTAGAYLRKSTVTFQQYLDTYEDRWQVDHSRLPQIPEYENRAFYTTWNLSYDQLANDDPEAARMLRLLTYFDNKDVWFELLNAGSKIGVPPVLQQPLTNRMDFESVMATLVEYCFIEAQTATQSYTMHNCIHDWLLARLNQNDHRQLYGYVIDCIQASIGSYDLPSLGHQRYSRLVPHASHLVHPLFVRDGALGLTTDRLGRASHIAEMLREQVRFLQVEQMYLQILPLAENTLGSNHPVTLAAVNNLGALYADQGRLEEAEPIHRQALAGYERSFGPNCSETLHAANNLGILYYQQDRFAEAEQMYQRALNGKDELSDLDRITRLNIVHNLGLLYTDQGRFEEAEKTYRQAIRGREEGLGSDHVRTLDSVFNLGTCLLDQGRSDEAEPLIRRALVGREETLGPNHTSTIASKQSLANLYFEQGQLDLVEPIYQQVLEGYEAAVGVDHPMTLTTVDNIGLLYATQQRLDEAEQIWQRALAGYHKRLGSDHSRTRAVADQLAGLHRHQAKVRVLAVER